MVVVIKFLWGGGLWWFVVLVGDWLALGIIGGDWCYLWP